MKNVLFLLSLSCFISFSALGQTFDCDRTGLDPIGFKNRSAAESWYNQNITIIADFNQKTATYKGYTSDLWIRDDKRRMKIQFVLPMQNGPRLLFTFLFLANGEVHADLGEAGGYQSSGGAVYKCSGWNGSL